jgi:CRP-like cAMP-binding protein
MRGRVFSAFFVTRDVMFMIGMAMAGLADIFDVRMLYLFSSLVILLVGIVILFMPGFGLPAAEWRRALTLLRSAPERSGLGIGRVLTASDFERLLALVPPMSSLGQERKKRLLTLMTLHEVKAGTVIIRRNEKSDSAFFVLEGQAFAGWDDGRSVKVLEVLRPGDFFGEIAALTGALRGADVIVDQPTILIRISGQTLRELSTDPQFNRILFTRMTERMMRTDMIDVTQLGQFYQQALLDLRTATAT